jgi:hypothetical protein
VCCRCSGINREKKK